MADGHHESKLLKISFALKDTQLTQTCSQGHVFSVAICHGDVSLYLGSSN